MASDPPRDTDLPPGYDEDDPYEGVDLSSYPAWWRRNIEEFRDHGMRPYRPPRLSDGTLMPPLVAELEEEYDVNVSFRSRDPQGSGWELYVDSSPVRSVTHERKGSGYTVYQIGPDQLERAIREHKR
jgi:hypothetical protein